MSADLPSVDSGWNYYDPSASEANFRDLIERGRSANDQAYVAEASTQLARSIGMQRRFEQAFGQTTCKHSGNKSGKPFEKSGCETQRPRVQVSCGCRAQAIRHLAATRP